MSPRNRLDISAAYRRRSSAGEEGAADRPRIDRLCCRCYGPNGSVFQGMPQCSNPPKMPEQTHNRQWLTSISQIATEDSIDIGNGRYAHFRRDRRFAQVHVVFTAPKGINPNPGRELTDQFKEQGWTWEPHKPGKPWTYQLEQSSEHDPDARGDSRDALHEQFLLIIQEYRLKHGLPATIGWENLAGIIESLNTGGRLPDALADQPHIIHERQKPQSEDRETRAGAGEGGEAQAMLDAFASVGAERFDLTLTDAAGEKSSFSGNRPLEQLRPAMPAILAEAAGQRHNVIVRPRSSGATLVQLDDLGEEAAARLQPVSFLTLRTSTGNYQAWIAVADGDGEFARRLRKGTGADLTASGAARVSGSINFKEKHAPDYPCVETVHACPGLLATKADLEDLGVVAPAEQVTPAQASTSRHRPAGRGWPSYERCLEHPKAQKEGRPDRSKADYTFCVLAIDWGWSAEETADRLMQVSSKAQENGEAYAQRTARAAARAVEGRGVSCR